jgi:hypothetical protein
MKKILSRLACMIRSIVGGERSYGCLPEDAGTPHPERKAGKPASYRPEASNSVEKEKPLR